MMAAPVIQTKETVKMEENNEKRTDWASDLINDLLTVTQSASEHLPEGFSFDGVSLQKQNKGSFNVTFSFKSDATR